jgi:hypothetical protein
MPAASGYFFRTGLSMLRFLAEILVTKAAENYENAYFQARSLYLADQALWACLINKFS